jgi:hypothetical protein
MAQLQSGYPAAAAAALNDSACLLGWLLSPACQPVRPRSSSSSPLLESDWRDLAFPEANRWLSAARAAPRRTAKRDARLHPITARGSSSSSSPGQKRERERGVVSFLAVCTAAARPTDDGGDDDGSSSSSGGYKCRASSTVSRWSTTVDKGELFSIPDKKIQLLLFVRQENADSSMEHIFCLAPRCRRRRRRRPARQWRRPLKYVRSSGWLGVC